jgi:hypothetical protein
MKNKNNSQHYQNNFNIKFLERGKMDNPNTQMYGRSLSWFDTSNTQMYGRSLSWFDTPNTQMYGRSLSWLSWIQALQ